MAVPEYENGRVVVPAVQAFTSRGAQVTKVDLPIVENIDISDYTAIKKSVDYFFDIPAGCPKYIANIDETGYGLLQISTDRLRSRKLFPGEIRMRLITGRSISQIRQDVIWRFRQDLERHSMDVFRWRLTQPGSGWNSMVLFRFLKMCWRKNTGNVQFW